MAAAAEASLLRCKGFLDTGCLPLLVLGHPRSCFEEAALTYVESLRVPFGCPSKAGHRKGRRRSSRLEQDCLYASRCNERFEARTNIVQGLTGTEESVKPGVIATKHGTGAMRWEAWSEDCFCASRT